MEDKMTIDKVKKLLAGQLGIAEDKINENSRLVEDLGADSLDMIEMLMSLEENFGLSVSDEEAVNLKTVKDIVDYIDKNAK